MKTKEAVLTALLLIVLALSIYGTEAQTTNILRMRFTQHINPTKTSDGLVVLGIPSIDSLNFKYGCNGFILQDDHSTTHLKELITFIYPSNIINEPVIAEYQTRCSGLYDYICPGFQYIDSTPGDYLISSELNHSQDVLGRILDDYDSKQYWGAYIHFNQKYRVAATGYVSNWDIHYDEWDIIENFASYNVEDVADVEYGEMNEFDTPNQQFLGTGYQFHGNMGLWQLTPEYSNTLAAWDYTMGKTKDGQRIIALMYDMTGFSPLHPDLVDVALPYLPLPAHDNDYTTHSRHGTACLGAMAARVEENSQNGEFNIYSAAGVAPEIQVVGLNTSMMYNFASIRNQLILHGDYNRVKVFSSSISPMTLFDNEMNQMILDGILPVMSRGYIHPNFYYGTYADSPDHVVVGDYLPNYSVKTYFVGSNETCNAGPYYKASINAPGFIWTTGFNPASPYPQYSGLINYGDPVICIATNTSIATPQAAGIAALVSAMYPWMTPVEVKNQVIGGAHHLQDIIDNSLLIPELQNCPPSNFGAGAVNAMSALYLHGDFSRDFLFSNEMSNTALIGKEFELVNSSMTVNNGTLRVEKNADVLFTNSTLNLADNVTVILEGYSKITLDANSNINIGNNVTFTNENGEPCYGIFINGDTQTIIANCSFNNCDLNTDHGSLEIVNTSFVNSAINCYRTDVSITDCPLLGGVYCNESDSVEIVNGTEQTYNITGSYDGIALINCGYAYVYGYTITGNVRNGINLHESYGSNTIENCSIISNSQDGVRMYHSSARIIGCQISGNQKGVIAYRGSNLEILKDPNSAPWFHDSCITNNTWMEVLFTDDCDLQMAHGMNKILDAPYNPDTFDKYLVFCPNMTRSRDLGVNYWGSDPQGMPVYPVEERFEPACINPDVNEIGFSLDPLWNPGPPSIITWENDELVYHSAIDLALAEDIIGAIALFKELISQYPGSDFAPDAAKNLLALEEDKQALKDYYATAPNLHWNGEIDKLADYLENYCNIKMGDYQAAISWFEDIISDPDCELDSLMAVIDLGYVYLLMQENSPKAQITCQYPQLVPKSRTQYEQKTNSILSALYSPANGANQEDGADTIPILPQIPVLHNNYPNPFNPSTSISFSLPAEMQCSLSIYNIKGQKVKTLQSGTSTQGNHTLIWNGRDDNGMSVSSGIYFYQLKAQGDTITKKMIMVK